MRQVNFYRYAKLIENETPYARRMKKLSHRIFCEPTPTTSSKSLKVVKILSALPKDKDPWFVNWYPRHVETQQLTLALRDYGLYRDEHEDFRDEMLRLKELKGKNWKKNWLIKLGKLKA